ncbi:hypothetical protein BDF14DRAFT_302765 [Spinellus fusiger]|nr:hypothetical protein BDF14DRAFT_302765 [Spinellus fusiger]
MLTEIAASPKELNKTSTYPTWRIGRSLQGVRHLWASRPTHNDTRTHHTPLYSKGGMAAITVTFTAETCTKADIHAITLLHPSMDFMPHGDHFHLSGTASNSKAFVHYEPSANHVAMGSNPDAKDSNSLWLTVDQYAWLIQQLQEEQSVHEALKADTDSASMPASSLGETRWGAWIHPRTTAPAPMLGVLHVHICTRTLTRRLSRWIRRKKSRSSLPDIYCHCNFILPKALLLQAAAYIPLGITLPLSVDTSRWGLETPFEPVHMDVYQRLLRYAHRLALSAHAITPGSSVLSSHSSPPLPPLPSLTLSMPLIFPIAPSFVHPPPKENTTGYHAYCALTCKMCQCTTGLEMALSAISSLSSTSAMENVSRCSATSASVYERGTSDTPTGRETGSQFPENSDTVLMNPTFPISFFQTIWSPDAMACAQKPRLHQERPLDSTVGPSPIPPLVSESFLSEESFSSLPLLVPFKGSAGSERRGYVAIDHEQEEILVVFPGTAPSDTLFENVSYTSVPWQEAGMEEDDSDDEEGDKECVMSVDPPVNEYTSSTRTHFFKSAWVRASSLKKKSRGMDIHKQNVPYPTRKDPSKDASPWVLDYAMTAWRRCELKVATLLMRVCLNTPLHYRVVILGHSLGGGVAALCASSLVSTRLLVNRSVTLCTINSPRVGNRAFVNHLARHVETIRIVHPSDLVSHLPPRTSGLVHVGTTTVLMALTDSTSSQTHANSSMLKSENPIVTEDLLASTFLSTHYDTRRHYMAWDVDLSPTSCVSV